jgi:iron(III) transport system permease protein
VENASRSLGASRLRVFLSVTLPLSLPAILSAFLIVFAKSLSDFGNPQVLAGDYAVLSVSAYTQITGLYNIRTGSFMAISILVPSMLAFFIQKYWVSKKSFVTITGKPVGAVDYISEKHIVGPLFAICILLTFCILLFYGTVVWVSLVKTWGVDMSFSLKNFQFVFSSGSGKRALKDTLILSLIATPVTALLGMGISFLLVRKKFVGRKVMEFASMLPFAVPGIALGIGYVISFNERPFILTGTAAIIIITLVFRTLSVGVEAGSNSLRQMDKSIEEASTVLGANNFTTFTRISLPIMKSALFSGLLNAFVRSMTSVSAIIFLVSVKWNLLTVSIMSAIESNKLGLASAYCVLLMAVVLVVMMLLELLVNRTFSRRSIKHV